MADATNTYIVHQEAASRALAAMAARASMLRSDITSVTAEITRLEAGKPWGRTHDYGTPFETRYLAGGNGSEYIKTQVSVVADETETGVTEANRALMGTVALDHEGAGLFKVKNSEEIGQRMSGIKSAQSSIDGLPS